MYLAVTLLHTWSKAYTERYKWEFKFGITARFFIVLIFTSYQPCIAVSQTSYIVMHNILQLLEWVMESNIAVYSC